MKKTGDVENCFVSIKNLDKDRIRHLFRFAKSMGFNLFLHTPIECGDDKDIVNLQDNPNTPFKNRRNLVNVKQTTPLNHDSIYGYDFMHGVSNAILRTLSYLFGEFTSKQAKNKELKSVILQELFDMKDVSSLLPYWSSIPESIVMLALEYLEDWEAMKTSVLYKKKNFCKVINFKNLTCSQRMSFAFQGFPFVFGDSFDNPIIRLFTYVFQNIASLYSLRGNLSEAYYLQEELLILLATIEGLVFDQFTTLAIHMFSHCFKTILQCGPLKNLDTFHTESTYRIEGDTQVNSRNKVKTLGIRMRFINHSHIVCHTQEEKELKKDVFVGSAI